MEKEMEIVIPEGYEIDKEKSSFNKIVFKKVEPIKQYAIISGCFINNDSEIIRYSAPYQGNRDYNVFATKQQAKSALAMARISQIMANDRRFGGIVTDEEWKDCNTKKFVICRCGEMVNTDFWYECYHFLAFHTKEQRNLFLEENTDLVKDYLMIE